ncbi:hypothetical protein BpHYR1_012760 [Brachionus plicatilis]|uniref:Uncharacterized protein n=1 Tax=Brachionus plicatilis TaxID=10195 RepID=A0A3M7STB9_BRAPC|nr:hypothetical protein BpHYR1_012760 [Brachionus plicatilis]
MHPIRSFGIVISWVWTTDRAVDDTVELPVDGTATVGFTVLINSDSLSSYRKNEQLDGPNKRGRRRRRYLANRSNLDQFGYFTSRDRNCILTLNLIGLTMGEHNRCSDWLSVGTGPRLHSIIESCLPLRVTARSVDPGSISLAT